MKVYVCDKCKTILQDGPVGGYVNVTIEFQPAYGGVDKTHKIELCPQHSEELRTYVENYLDL